MEQKRIRSRISKAAITVLAAITLISCVVIFGGSPSSEHAEAGKTAVLTIHGEPAGEIPLYDVTIAYDYRIETAEGYNILRVEKNAISVIEADCPGQDCVKMGRICTDELPIVCLPHGLVITIKEQNEE